MLLVLLSAVESDAAKSIGIGLFVLAPDSESIVLHLDIDLALLVPFVM